MNDQMSTTEKRFIFLFAVCATAMGIATVAFFGWLSYLDHPADDYNQPVVSERCADQIIREAKAV